jgi:hypothetical protein
MARTNIPIEEIPANGGSLEITGIAGDATNDHSFVNDGRTLLYVKNGDVSAKQATVVSVSDQFGRTGDEVLSVTAGETALFGPFLPAIWNQAGGVVNVDLDADTSVEVAAVRYNPPK